MNTAELKQLANHLRMVAVDMVYKGKWASRASVVHCRYYDCIIF